ncbi:MAG: carboxypeptidase-like regulatory domain-containing protein, partial [Flavobacterium sp.]|nr:carboxypeptidase-like regulatory domain-containing protein [Flavobacterium sp.]
MLKKSLLIASLLFTSLIFSQNTVSLKGKIIDKNSSVPLESATIYLKSVKDSTLIDYTISDKNGNFIFKTKKTENSIYFKISYIGYNDYTEKIENLKADIDFGSIKLEENVSSLKEIIIQSEAPPVTIKNDTLEFNASSFKVRPDANVEALLKQLPGVEIDEEGKITVNGKEVNKPVG